MDWANEWMNEWINNCKIILFSKKTGKFWNSTRLLNKNFKNKKN